MTINKKKTVYVIIGISLILGFGSLMNFQINTPVRELESEQVVEVEEVELPITIQILSGHNVMDGLREKKITVGDTEIQFTVGVEKGIEETPSLTNPTRSLARSEYGPIMGTIDLSRYYSKLPSGFDPIIELDLTELLEMTKIHRYDKLKKEYIDTNFTCGNYHELAWKFAGENMWAAGYGDVEEYIYEKAIDECIDPQRQQKLDKVYEELEKASAEN